MPKTLACSFVVTMSATLGAACARPAPPTAAGDGASTAATMTATSPIAMASTTPSATAPPPAKTTRKRHRTAPQSVGHYSNTPLAYADLVPQNPTDAGGRTIYASQEDLCYIEVPMKPPYPPMPTGSRAIESAYVDCPAELDDPAWDACSSSTLFAHKGKTECWCAPMGGNPPPPPVQVACPKKIKR